MFIKKGWSFGIITDGYHQSRVKRIIDSILSQKIKNFEIIIVGDNNENYNYNDCSIKLVEFKSDEEWSDNNKVDTFPISIKKNLIVERAVYENLCFLHDYVILDKNWYLGILKFEKNNEWKVLTNKILNSDNSRVFDWVLYDHPLCYRKVTYLPQNKKITKYQYIPGYYWCVKKNIMVEFKLNESLKWGQKEDVEWSKRVRKKYDFSFNNFSSVKFLKYKYGPWSKNNPKYKKVMLRTKFIKILVLLKLL